MKYPATISYIVFIIIVNVLYSYLPRLPLWGELISPANVFIGFIYIFRDLAQREIRHYVLIAMLVGAIISYLLSAPAIAIASVVAFVVGELLEWLIFTFTKKPLSQRLLWSACISVPIDSAVFLYWINFLNVMEFGVQTLAKMIGVLGLWYIWRYKHKGDSYV